MSKHRYGATQKIPIGLREARAAGVDVVAVARKSRDSVLLGHLAAHAARVYDADLAIALLANPAMPARVVQSLKMSAGAEDVEQERWDAYQRKRGRTL